MRLPLQIISSLGLGSTFSSEESAPLASVEPLNAGQTQIALNAATGNVFLRDKIFTIPDTGCELQLGMVWNSLLHRFNFATAPSFVRHMQTSFLGWGEAKVDYIMLTEPDGCVVKYNLIADEYVADRIDSAGRSVIKLLPDGNFQRTFVGSGVIEIFNLIGQMTSRIYPPGQTFTFKSDSDDLTITLPSQRQVHYTVRADTEYFDLSISDSASTTHLATYKLTNNAQNLESIFGSKLPYTTQYTYTNDTLMITGDDQRQAQLTLNNKQQLQTLTLGVGKEAEQWAVDLNETEQTLQLSHEDQPVVTVSTGAGQLSRVQWANSDYA